MSYIGNTTQNQNYVPAIDYFNGDGSTVAFTLSRPVASVAAVQAVISNVPQNPGSAFTVSGSTITFTSVPPSGTNNIYVYYTSPNTQVVQPGQGTVGATQVDGNYALWNKSGSTINYTAGNVGVGTSSPGAKMDVQGGNIRIYEGSTNYGQLDFTRTSDSATYASIKSVYDGSGYGSNLILATANNSGAINAPVERMRVLSTGNILCLSGGSTSATGTGIAFPATQSASSDANTLDDYEEGTFTATLTGGGTNPSTPVTATASYTKIGNTVYVKIEFAGVNTTGASGQIIVTGLPFSATTAQRAIGPVAFYSMATFSTVPFGLIESPTQITFYASASNTGWTAVTHNAGTVRYLQFSCTYTTT